MIHVTATYSHYFASYYQYRKLSFNKHPILLFLSSYSSYLGSVGMYIIRRGMLWRSAELKEIKENTCMI